MKLATLRNGTADGRLVVVSRDLTQALDATDIAPNLQQALEQWDSAQGRLEERFGQIQSGAAPGAFSFDQKLAMAPLPRAYQWCDGSAFLHHGRLMEKAFKHPPRENFETIPLLYQGGSDSLLGARDDVALPDEADGIDFEGEFAVFTRAVPMGCAPRDALSHVALLGAANDWSLRNLIPREILTGFGFFQSKPSTSFSPVVITPDELGEDWREGRVHLDLHVEWNGQWFGNPNGGSMHFDFGELISHAARTRRLCAGTIIGSGTVSNDTPGVGSACISERRIIEIIEGGKPKTNFMKFGDRIVMEGRNKAGVAPFGAIDQRVTSSS